MAKPPQPQLAYGMLPPYGMVQQQPPAQVAYGTPAQLGYGTPPLPFGMLPGVSLQHPYAHTSPLALPHPSYLQWHPHMTPHYITSPHCPPQHPALLMADEQGKQARAEIQREVEGLEAMQAIASTVERAQRIATLRYDMRKL